MAWTTPKTDWSADSRFNIDDLNRIRDNINYLSMETTQLIKVVETETTSAHLTNYRGFWTAEYFNTVERDLEKFESAYNHDFGTTRTYYPNGAFITYDELNRIEEACLWMYEYLEKIKRSFRKLPFRFGAFKDIRI